MYLWSSDICTQWRFRSVSPAFLQADQNLYWEHFGLSKKGCKISSCGQWRLWSDYMDAQADLRWAHMPEGMFFIKLQHFIWIPPGIFFSPKVLIFFLFVHRNICCGYSLEAPCRGASNEYPQHMFLWTNKKNTKPDTHSYLDLCVTPH